MHKYIVYVSTYCCLLFLVHSVYYLHLQCESKKVAPPPKTFCDIFTCGKPLQLKIIVAIAQTYFYVYTNFGPFI